MHDRVNARVDVLVLGIGNTLMGDEGVGVHALRILQTCELPAGVECLDGGTGSFQLLEPLARAARVIMIDATADGAPVGTVSRLSPRFSSDYPPTLAAHDIGLKDLLDVLYLTGAPADVTLYTISIRFPTEVGLELSDRARAGAQVAATRIGDELRSSAGPSSWSRPVEHVRVQEVDATASSTDPGTI